MSCIVSIWETSFFNSHCRNAKKFYTKKDPAAKSSASAAPKGKPGLKNETATKGTAGTAKAAKAKAKNRGKSAS